MVVKSNVIKGGLAVVVLSFPLFLPSGRTGVADAQSPTATESQAQQKQEAKSHTAAQAPVGEYVGEATCLTCHTDKSYKGTPHGMAFNERTPAANHGCESCHGPGKAHAESGDPALIRRLNAMPPSEASETCTACHNRATHALWDGSQHTGNTGFGRLIYRF